MKKRLKPAMVVAMKKGRVLSLFALALCVWAAVTAGTASPADAAARAVKQSCRVPAVVGRTLVVAKAGIRKAHCRVGSVRYVRSTARQKNRVVSQRPTRGRKLPNGGRVHLVVGRGPATSAPPSLRLRLWLRLRPGSGSAFGSGSASATAGVSATATRDPPPPPPPATPLRFDFSDAAALALPQPGAVAMASATPQTTLSSMAALTASAAPESTSGGSSNLAAVTASGTLEPVVTSGSANVAQFFIAPDQTVYVVFTRPINLSDTTSWEGPRCLLAQVDRATGVPSCVDGTLSSISWPYPGSGGNPPIQFDAAGAVYYSGRTMIGRNRAPEAPQWELNGPRVGQHLAARLPSPCQRRRAPLRHDQLIGVPMGSASDRRWVAADPAGD